MNRRFIAYVLDGLALTVVALVCAAVIPLGIGAIEDALVQVVIIGAIGLGYFAISWTQLGGSPFQRLLGIRTLSAADGALMTTSQAVRRWAILYGPGVVASALSVIPGAGAAIFLSIFYAYYLYRTASRDPQRRGLHDHQSGTIVVKTSGMAATTAP